MTSTSAPLSFSVQGQPLPPAFLPAQDLPILVVGHRSLADKVGRVFEQIGTRWRVEKEPGLESILGGINFGRDSKVVRPDGSYLLPYPLDLSSQETGMSMLKAILPETSAHLMGSDADVCGRGFLSDPFFRAKRYAEAHSILTQPSRTVIEGGNLFWLRASRAIVGVHSVLLSLLALEEQRYFARPEVVSAIQVLSHKMQMPSDESLRIVRNVSYRREYQERVNALFHAFLDHILCHDAAEKSALRVIRDNLQLSVESDYGEIEEDEESPDDQWTQVQNVVSGRKNYIGYLEMLIEPMAGEKDLHADLAEEAKIWDAKIALTKEVMAEELGIKAEDLIVVPQRNYHIDLEMAVEEGSGTVFMDNPALTGDASYGSGPLAEHLQTIYLKTADLLTERGCRVVGVPGIFEREDASVSFLNGCFVPGEKGVVFLTGGAERELEEIFKRAFQGGLPDAQVVFVQDPVFKILQEADSGLHCVTFLKGKKTGESDKPDSVVEQSFL